jgi:hypothetical protein
MAKQDQIRAYFRQICDLKLAVCLAAIIMLGTYSDYKEFIYFQF